MPINVARLSVLILILCLAACQPAPPAAAPVTPLTFTYWGSDMERAAVESMVAAFEARNPDIDVQTVQIPYEEYLAQVTTMLNQRDAPDVGYFSSLHAPVWAQEGMLLDLTELVETDPLLASALPVTRYYYGGGKIAGLNTAVEATLLFYNKEVLDRARVPYPPSDPTQAWTWEQFVDAARRITTDAKGKHPGDPGFDPFTIVTYGAAFDKTYEGWTSFPFVFSNGGEVVDEEGAQLLLNSPEAVEAMQALADLMWVDHVAPTPAQDAYLPGYVPMLETGNLGMHISGHWSLLDYASVEGLRFGVAVLPKFKTPVTVVLGSPTVIFAKTPHREAAVRFYKFHNNPEAVDLFARGLWMPLQQAYYTDPDKMRLWLDNPVHPQELWPVFTDYIANYSRPMPSTYLRNYASVLDMAIRPALEKLWSNQVSAAEAMRQAVQAAAPLMDGRWDR